MKRIWIIALAIVALAFLLMPLLLLAQDPLLVATNAPTAPAVTNAPIVLPPGVEQVASLLGPKVKAFVGQLVIWIGSLSLIIAPFAVKIEHLLRDRLNAIAESKEENTDMYLRGLFSNGLYRFVAFLLRFVNVNLPTTSDLERAVKLQQEAVQEAANSHLNKS